MTPTPVFKTQRELLETQRKQLDERYVEKYPQGKFCVQYRGDMGLLEQGLDFWGLHWSPTRSTGAVKRKGITIYLRKYLSRETNIISSGIEHATYQNCSFGKCNNYDSLEKMIAFCAKRDVPKELVEAFQKRYQDRHLEGFKV
jgi:hypothetical protein